MFMPGMDMLLPAPSIAIALPASPMLIGPTKTASMATHRNKRRMVHTNDIVTAMPRRLENWKGLTEMC